MTRGTVVAIRVLRCLSPACGSVTRTAEISLGLSEKAYARDRSEARGTPGYETDDSIVLEDAGHGLAVIRL